MENRKAFISYSWTTPQHEDWVIQLANRLVQDGVDIVLDKWDLKEGNDKFTFMETMVNSSDIDKVLLILDKKYSERADERKGGVGTETMIITPQVYEHAEQEKFIPVVAEVDEEGKAFLPAYLKGRIYVDLSSKDYFEANYEKLLRNIYNRPSLSKPKLGSAPKYLFEDSPVSYKTTTMVRGLDTQLDKHPGRVNALLRDFLDEFFTNLQDFALDENAGTTYDEVGEAAFNKLNQYKVLKNDYVQYIKTLLKTDLPFDFDIILHFFERLPMLLAPMDDNVRNWQGAYYEHFKLIIHELFLYTVGLGMKMGNYGLLEHIFHSRYIIKERYERPKNTDHFTVFRYYYNLMDQYYKKLKGKNFFSVHADYIVNNMAEGFSRDIIVDADLLAFYIAELNDWSWFPVTYVYKGDNRHSFDIFSRLVSKKHFNKVKGVLGKESMEELKIKLKAIKAEGKPRGYPSSFDNIPGLDSYIDADQIGVAL